MSEHNPSAFPLYGDAYVREFGMTLRDYFAGQALVGLANSEDLNDDEIAAAAYSIANEMLKERVKS